MPRRMQIDVNGVPASYLTAGAGGPIVLMLHGTYWSRVWQPVLDDLAASGLRPIAVDLPGFGRSGGELTLADATIPKLADWVARFYKAIGGEGPVGVAAHDIGGAIAQHLLVKANIPVSRLALMNAVMYDSWPQPKVARFRDPAVVAATTTEGLLEVRREAVIAALAPLAASEELVTEYLDPLTDPRVSRSWMALAGAADCKYTLDLVPELRTTTAPKLLVWGEDDPFQQIKNAERFVSEMPNAKLVRIPKAGHIPTEIDAGAIARPLSGFFAA